MVWRGCLRQRFAKEGVEMGSSGKTREQEHEWLTRQPDLWNRYRGEYIAIIGEQVVAHGKHLQPVLEQATAVEPDPLVIKIPSHELMIL